MTIKNRTVNEYEDELARFALTYPEAWADNPWDHIAVKVKKKVFIFTGSENGELGLSVKLPLTGELALTLPFTTPTGYGLGKAGWVSASFAAGEEPPMHVLKAWVDESYRAIAPKTLVKKLGEPLSWGSAPASKKPASKKASSTKKPAAKKAAAKKKASSRKKPASKKKR